MKFEEYARKSKLILYQKTEQSNLFLTNKGTLIKHYFNDVDKRNELLFYSLLKCKKLIKSPKIYSTGNDFAEFELIKNEGKHNLIKIIKEISNLYNGTIDEPENFGRIDLSKEKLFYRINYLREEIKDKGIDDTLLDKCEKFIEYNYYQDNRKCVIHGDLKSPHIFFTADGIKFIDFALAKRTNPLYDLSFLVMEKDKGKEDIFKDIVESSYLNLSKEYGYNKEEITCSLRSSIFYRTLYLLGFALRHRPKNSIERIIKELEDIMSV